MVSPSGDARFALHELMPRNTFVVVIILVLVRLYNIDSATRLY